MSGDMPEQTCEQCMGECPNMIHYSGALEKPPCGSRRHPPLLDSQFPDAGSRQPGHVERGHWIYVLFGFYPGGLLMKTRVLHVHYIYILYGKGSLTFQCDVIMKLWWYGGGRQAGGVTTHPAYLVPLQSVSASIWVYLEFLTLCYLGWYVNALTALKFPLIWSTYN